MSQYLPMATPARQRGQSLVEVAIACLVVVPLLLLVPILGKYAYMRHTAAQMTRAAVWEASVADPGTVPDNNPMRQRLLGRFHAGPDAVVDSRTSTISGGNRLGDAMLNTYSNRPLLNADGIVLQRYANAADSGFMGNLGALMGVIPGDFPPNRNGLVTAHSQVRPDQLRYRSGTTNRFLNPFDSMQVSIDTRSTLLVDAWNASGPGRWNDRNPLRRSVVSQVRSLSPTAALAEYVPELDFVSALPIFGVIGDLDVGLVEPDVTPTDKLPRNAPAQ